MSNSLSHIRVVPIQSQSISLRNNALRKLFVCEYERPLAIHVDARKLDGSNMGALLLNELTLWRQVLGPRKITDFELHYFDQYLEPYEITSFIHHLASVFKIEKPVYRVVIKPEEAESSVLALLKGLGFQQCQFVFERIQNTMLDMLKQPFSTAKALQFSHIGVQLRHSSEMANLTESITLLQKYYDPDYIFVGNSTNKLSSAGIEQGGTLFENDLDRDRTDSLCLGPGGNSQICSYEINTLFDPKRYTDAIKSHSLPINKPNYA